MPAQTRKNKYATTSWGQEVTIDLTVPSGQLCLVRRPGVTGLIKAGILDSLDSLTGIVQTEHIDRVENEKKGLPAVTPEQIKELQSNKQKLLEALELMDKVLAYVVIQPALFLPYLRDEEDKAYVEPLTPLPDDKRVPGRAYVDMVDIMDKVFVFQFVVGGVSDLERFREEFGESLAGLEALTDVSATA